jgi:hyperosmotically inducible protein
MARIIFLFSLSFLVNPVQAFDLKTMNQSFNDARITALIIMKFTKNNINPFNVAVRTHNGTVTLKGHVKNKQAFIDSLIQAKSTDGVIRINVTNLEIQQKNTGLTDTYITTKVEAAVLAAKILDDTSIPLVGINATTKNGFVTLTGTVEHPQSIAAILKRIYRIQGVKKITSNLQVRS